MKEMSFLKLGKDLCTLFAGVLENFRGDKWHEGVGVGLL